MLSNILIFYIFCLLLPNFNRITAKRNAHNRAIVVVVIIVTAGFVFLSLFLFLFLYSLLNRFAAVLFWSKHKHTRTHAHAHTCTHKCTRTRNTGVKALVPMGLLSNYIYIYICATLGILFIIILRFWHFIFISDLCVWTF